MSEVKERINLLYICIADGVKKNVEGIKRRQINSRFVFLKIEKSCKLIALFEALMAILQIILIARKGNYAPNSPYFLWVPGDRKGMRLRSNSHFTIGLNLITIFNSLLLYIGTIRKYFVCLYLWIYITIFTFAMCTLNTMIRNYTAQKIFLGGISLIFECYCIFLVVYLILKYHDQLVETEPEKLEELDSDFEE